jgi:uncharacterized protein YndB with AHSA1/START domain
MFEATHGEDTSAPPAAVWALWRDPARWPEWNSTYDSAELDGELEPGAEVTVKLHRGGRMKREVVAVEPERLLIDQARFPGARFGHEHRVEPRSAGEGGGSRITHRVYVKGPASGLWALMLGRKRLRASVAKFCENELELVESS